MKANNFLLDSQPLIVIPELAVAIGLNEAIILQQLHYWIKKSHHNYHGRAWVYNSMTNWQAQFPFFSDRTMRRAFDNLHNSGLIIKGNFNKLKFDKTSWYSIDYDKLNKVESTEIINDKPDVCSFGQNDQTSWSDCHSPYGQNDQMGLVKMTTPIPETTQRIPKTTTTLVQKEAEKLQTDQFLQFWSAYPKKQDRAKALRAWLKIKMNTDLYQTILTALETQKKGIQWQKNGGQFIPLATTWLNGQRWTDEVINYKQGDKSMTETQRRQASFEAATRGARQQDQEEFFEAQFNEVGAK